MYFTLIGWAKILSAVVIITTTCIGSARASWDEYIDEETYTLKKQFPTSTQKRHKTIQDIFSHSDVPRFNLSESNINDEDLKDIAIGLALREANGGNQIGLKTLDLRKNAKISENGIKKLLGLFQDGISLEIGGEKKKIYPDIRQTKLYVPSTVNITEELLEEWFRRAPSVFAGGLKIKK